MGELVDDVGQPAGQLGRGPLQSRLGREHGHLQHVVLEVAAIQQDQRAFQGWP
jgi:hypothetical protein